ncbi:MAG: hypothetical protein ACK4NN_16110 [Rheinheimera sp.]
MNRKLPSKKLNTMPVLQLWFVKAAAFGLLDVREGNTASLEDAKKALGIRSQE